MLYWVSMIEEKLLARQSLQTVADFEREAPEHYAVVKQDMAGLLQAGLDEDLKSAYDAALRMPAHSQIWDSMQQQLRDTQDKEKLEAARKAAEAARRNNISGKSATPASAGSVSPKGRRAQLESAYDEVIGGSRV